MTEEFNREAWLRERKQGIGGSDAAAVVGLSRWRTPYDVWLDKTSPEVIDDPGSEAMEWGRRLEPVLLQKYQEVTGRDVTAIRELVRHSEYPWMAGSLDGHCLAEGRLVECKCTGFDRDWGEAGTDQIPQEYLLQVHHYMIVTGVPVADVPVLIHGNQFRIYTVEANPFVQKELIDREAEFWQRVLHGEPPPPVNLQDAVKQWGRLAAQGAVYAEPAVEEAARTLRAYQRVEKHNKARMDELRAVLVGALADKGDTLLDSRGTVLATWKLTKGKASYTVSAQPPARRLLVKDNDAADNGNGTDGGAIT